MNLPLLGDAEARLSSWLDTLVAWNARMDLTAARSMDELLDLMLADALVLAGQIPSHAVVVDVGTGAGAPGFALACMRPDLELHIVDPHTKRISFLRVAASEAKVENTRLYLGNIEQVAHRIPPCDEATARATFAPEIWLDHARTLLQGAPRIWLFLAREPVPNGVAAEQELRYTWPMTGAERTLLAVHQTA